MLLAGNALAVHDVEQALYGTSLGVDMESGRAIEGGHRHHMRAINAIYRAGGLRAAVDSGVLTSGVMYECIRRNVDYVLAGSIRDDGPLPDTVMDLVEAQDRYAAALQGVKLVLVLSTMLHGIGVGNMLPSWVRMVCVDINPAVVTKLADRGSSQTIGIVTDVGLFLRQLRVALLVVEQALQTCSNGRPEGLHYLDESDAERADRDAALHRRRRACLHGRGQQAPVGYDDTPMQPNGRWHIHDGKRPQPKVVTPGRDERRLRRRRTRPCWSAPGADRGAWQMMDGAPVTWPMGNGVLVDRQGHDSHARRVHRLPAARRVRDAEGRQGQQPGARQQRRVPERQVRDSGARQLSEPDVSPTARRRRCTDSFRRW